MGKIRYISIFVAFSVLISQHIYSNNSGFNLNLSPELQLTQKKDSALYKLYRTADSLYKAKNYPVALELAYAVLDRVPKNENSELVFDTNYLIGKLFYKTESYEKSAKHFEISIIGYSGLIQSKNSNNGLDNEIVLSDDYRYLNTHFQLGKAYQKLYEELSSKRVNENQIFNKSDSIKVQEYKEDSFDNYNKILESGSLSKKISKLKSMTYNNLAGLYYKDSVYDKAEEYTLSSLEIKETLGDPISLGHGYNALSNIYFAKEQYEDSKQVFFKAVESLNNIKGERVDRLNAVLYLNLAYSMYMLKDYKAYDYQKKSWELYDKLDAVEDERILAGIEAQRNYEKGVDAGILTQEIKRQQAQTATIIIGASSLFIIILLVILLKQYKLRQKNLGLELSKQELIQQQKLEKIKNESQIRILNATLDGKESERKQIAETLHDSVSALLSSANLHLQACKTQFNGKTPIEVDKSQSIINEASQKIRDISHTLVSSILLKFGLSFAIKDIAEKFSNSELQIDHETRYIKRYDQGFEIKLYNIIQEFINNILKHSQASHAMITLVEKNKKLILIIEDNGQGFDKETIPEKDGLGINQIDARIQMMKGKFNIESGKGKGTKITIELPVFEKEAVTIS